MEVKKKKKKWIKSEQKKKKEKVKWIEMQQKKKKKSEKWSEIKKKFWKWRKFKSDPCVDTRFCTHDLIKEDDWTDHPCTLKSWLHYMH